MSKEGWCVGFGQEDAAWGWKNCLKYLKKGGGWTEKTGGKIEILKREGGS